MNQETLAAKLAGIQGLNLDDLAVHDDLPTDGCYRLLIRSQPFFEYGEAKEHFMIVVPPGRMLFE